MRLTRSFIQIQATSGRVLQYRWTASSSSIHESYRICSRKSFVKLDEQSVNTGRRCQYLQCSLRCCQCETWHGCLTVGCGSAALRNVNLNYFQRATKIILFWIVSACISCSQPSIYVSDYDIAYGASGTGGALSREEVLFDQTCKGSLGKAYECLEVSLNGKPGWGFDTYKFYSCCGQSLLCTYSFTC
jgi:hypothetical protein